MATMRLRACSRGAEQVGVALLGELLDEGGPAELFDEQGDVDGADVVAQHAGIVGTADDLLGRGVTARADGVHLLGDLDRAGDRAERARAGQHGVGGVVREPVPGVVVGEALLGGTQVVVQGEGAQVLEELLPWCGSAGTACRRRRRLVPRWLRPMRGRRPRRQRRGRPAAARGRSARPRPAARPCGGSPSQQYVAERSIPQYAVVCGATCSAQGRGWPS